MKKYLSTSLIILGLIFGLCAQPVLASDDSADAVVLGNDYETPVEITGGKLVNLPAGDDLYREGYVFVGWNTDPNATEGFFEYVMPNEDVTIYAIWEPVEITEGNKEEAPQCTCEPIDGIHAEDCPLYKEPEAPDTPEEIPPTEDGAEQQPEQPETGEPAIPDTDVDGEETPPTEPSEGDTDESQTEPQQPTEDAGGNKGDESGTVPSEPDSGTGDSEGAGGDASTEPPVENAGGDAESSAPEPEASPKEEQPSDGGEGSAPVETAPSTEADV